MYLKWVTSSTAKLSWIDKELTLEIKSDTSRRDRTLLLRYIWRFLIKPRLNMELELGPMYFSSYNLIWEIYKSKIDCHIS